jgi:hypothetical protein
MFNLPGVRRALIAYWSEALADLRERQASSVYARNHSYNAVSALLEYKTRCRRGLIQHWRRFRSLGLLDCSLTLPPTIAASHLPPRPAPPHLCVTPPCGHASARSRKPWTSIAAISSGHPRPARWARLRCRLTPREPRR